jgi:hypothetical protein
MPHIYIFFAPWRPSGRSAPSPCVVEGRNPCHRRSRIQPGRQPRRENPARPGGCRPPGGLVTQRPKASRTQKGAGHLARPSPPSSCNGYIPKVMPAVIGMKLALLPLVLMVM